MKVKRIGLAKQPAEMRVESKGQTYFVTIWKNGSLQVRPKGARKSSTYALATIDSIYRRALLLAADQKRIVRRGMIRT